MAVAWPWTSCAYSSQSLLIRARKQLGSAPHGFAQISIIPSIDSLLLERAAMDQPWPAWAPRWWLHGLAADPRSGRGRARQGTLFWVGDSRYAPTPADCAA